MTAPREVVLGVDGGGTKTIAVISDLEGQVLGYGRAGNIDIYNNSHAIDEVELAVMRACSEAGVTKADIASAVYSLCGCDWPEDFAYWRTALAERELGHHIEVVNDAVGALSSDVPAGNAIVIVSGTGAGIGSRNEAGDVWHSSFWQLRQGGHEMAQSILNAVYRADMGIDPPTAMTDLVLAYFAMESVEKLLHALTGRDQHRPQYIGGLVPLMFDAAEAGDAAARRIIIDFGTAYAEIAMAAARKVGIVGKPVHVLMAGRVFRHPSRLLRDQIATLLQAFMPDLVIVEGRSEPIKGAVTIALQARGVAVNDAVEQRLADTLPPPEFFHTHAAQTLPGAPS